MRRARYAPGRRRRACHQTPTRIRGPTRESADPRADQGPAPAIADPGAKCRVHVRGEERRQLALGAVSHAIRLSELSTASTNVAILTTWIRGTTQCRGNCMRHSWDSSPGGSHALPPIAPPVAPPVAQPATCQRHGTVNTVAANDLPKPHRDRSRSHAQTHDKTSTHTRCSVSPTQGQHTGSQ